MSVCKKWQLALVLLAFSNVFSMNAMGESLYDSATYRPYTGDNKAFKLDDILTVQVYENSSATSTSDTGSRRKNNINANVGRNGISVGQVGVEVGGDFDGGGKTQRANRLLATITVSVKEIFPNGDLRIAGQQLLTVNEEQQKVNIEGRVRRNDISDTNTVLSTRIADAKITYLGEGDLSERQRRSWWRIFLDGIGL